MAGITQELAHAALGVTFDDLPDSVVHKTKQVLLDCIGCALGGYAVDRSKIALEMVNELGGHPQAGIIGNQRASWALAAYANGELINALDFDPLGPLIGHVAPYVIPSSLAVGERAGASGKDLLTAIALGLEIGGRVGSSMPGLQIATEEPPYHESNPRFSYTITIFGAIAGAGKLLGLDTGEMANAFGIAGASTPVPAGQKWEQTAGPSIMTKYNCSTGWMSQLATVAVLLAERGFTGDTTILDGDWGFWKILGQPYFKPEKVIGDLGKVWHIEEMTIKAFPCCGANHTAIQALNKIMREDGINPDEIEQITVKGDPHLLTPNRSGTEINNFADTQFYNAYIFGLQPYYGHKPGPAWQLPATFTDPKVTSMMKKVKVELHPKAHESTAGRAKSGIWTISRDAIVEVTVKGKKFTAKANVVKGSQGDPQSDAEITAKFRNNAGYSMLKTGKVERAIKMIYELEKIRNIAELTKELTVE